MKKIALLCVAALLTMSCNNNKTGSTESSDKKSGASSSGNENVIRFKINGDQVTTSGWNINRFTWNNQSAVWMNITSDMHKEKRTINVNLNGAKPATYNFDEKGVIMNKSHGSYYPDFSDPSSSYSFINGSFVITEVDTVHNIVKGTFSGTVRNMKGETLSITDGKITNGILKPGITSL